MASYEKLRNHESASEEHIFSENSSVEDNVPDRWDKFGSGYWSRRSNRFKTVIYLLCPLLILALLAVFLLSWIALSLDAANASENRTPSEQSDNGRPSTNGGFSPRLSSCGSTTAEAIAAGCHFDIFSFGWYPLECSDMELYNQTLAVLEKQAEGLPTFYTQASNISASYEALSVEALHNFGRDGNSIQQVPLEEQSVFGTWEYNLVSCTYAWQKVQKAAMRNWPLEEWSASYALINRCGPDLLDRDRNPSESITNHLKVWYPRCGLEAEDLQKEIEAALR